jgi:sec-independent protein translocase protein TatA
MGLSTTHLIIFLVIIVLVFGTKKLKNAETTAAAPAAQVAAEKRLDSQTIDVEVKTKQ